MPFPNPRQKAIIDCLDGAVLVTAPAGTGKTRVLAARVREAVNRGRVEPARALCLTFTNRAAEEMRRALRDTGAAWAREVVVKTFHALCAYLLRAEAREIGLPADFVIYDEDDGQELVREVFAVNRAAADQKQRNEMARDLHSDLIDAKQDADRRDLSLSFPAPDVAARVFARFNTRERIAQAVRYQLALQQRHALDFGDLVYYTRAMLEAAPDVRRRWAGRFDFLQVDEMQDTHPSEYDVVRVLAEGSRNLAMIGDFAQTIYGWRGSKPDEIRARFERDFAPTQLPLQENYRATRVLLKAADAFARSCRGFGGKYAPLVPAAECEQGDNVEVAARPDERGEALWIGQRLADLSRPQLPAGRAAPAPLPFRFGRAAILTRTNSRAQVVHDAIQAGFGGAIPTVTVEAFEFFHRAEVKDALAHLRLLAHPNDAGAMRRVRVSGLGETGLSALLAACEPVGLRLSDFADERALQSGDPFEPVLTAHRDGDVVVFDTETTGLDPAVHEVIEIAARRLRRGTPGGEFHALIKVAAVGESVQVHGISDDELARVGRLAGDVLREFFDFARGALLVGHNVHFDVKMVAAHARRVGVRVPAFDVLDTFDAARRFVPSDNYRLETLAAVLGLPTPPTHRADADVRTTVELLGRLIPLMRENALQRVAVTGKYARLFKPLARNVSAWRQLAGSARPAAVLRRVLADADVLAAYPPGERAHRSANLDRLATLFADRDDPSLHPETALRALLDYAAMAKNVDQIAGEDDQVMICTVHQAKGLEFDHVFIAGAVEGEFPMYRAIQSGDPARLEEEARLFYVAMTRARRRLFITRHAVNRWNYHKAASPYLAGIDPAYVTEV